MTINHRHVLIHEGKGGAPRMTLSARGLDFIKQYEALSLTPFLDQAGNETIGYGHKIRPGEDFSTGITPAQAAPRFICGRKKSSLLSKMTRS